MGQGGFSERKDALHRLGEVVLMGAKHKEALVPLYELFTAPSTHILDRWCGLARGPPNGFPVVHVARAGSKARCSKRRWRPTP